VPVTRESSADRRAIITAGALLAGAGAAPARAAMGDAPPAGPRWQPAIEPQDAWFDRPGTRHRMVIDTTGAEAAKSAMFFADNFYASNKSGYGLEPAALGVAIVLRHMSTPFGFDDAMWAKYGAQWAKTLSLTGTDAIRATKGNPLLSAEDASDKDAVTLATLAGRGAIFPVCGMATHGGAMMLAKQTGGKAEAIEAELRAHLIPGGHMAASGIVALNRAQEHGYTFCYVPDKG
jgi:hypothetical protein